MTIRAIEVLKSVDTIVAEDTRKSSILLNHYEIKKPLESFHDHSSPEKIDKIMRLIESGKTVGYITDGGMPAISDPGFVLVREALRRMITVEVLPGPSAVLAALVASGLPCERFVFEGFLPQKSGKRRAILEGLKSDKRTLVFFESPYKLLARLKELEEILGATKRIVVARELTKMFEEVVRGSIQEVASHFSKSEVKGEIVVVVEGNRDE